MPFTVATFGNETRPYAKTTAAQMVSLAQERGVEIEVKFIPYKLNGDVPRMVKALQGVDVFVHSQLALNAVEIAAQLQPHLKLMQITSAGFDEFNHGGPDVMEGLRKAGVIFANNGGSNAVGVAETTIMLMLAACKNMFELATMVRARQWTAHHTALNVRGAAGARELSSQVVGIVGFGNIGRMVARYLSGFRCKAVLYFDVVELEVGRQGELDAEAVGSLDELLARADIVTVHVPNIPSTNGTLTGHKLMGKRQFAQMKPSAIYISTCRGPVTDHVALVEALKTGEIFGAGLDVLDPDPNTGTDACDYLCSCLRPRWNERGLPVLYFLLVVCADSPLLDMENVTVLPHMSPVGTPPERALGFLMDNLRRLQEGNKPLLAVHNNAGHSDGIFDHHPDDDGGATEARL